MSDRLAELVRQRAIVEEHLAWLDRQLAEAARNSLAQPSARSSNAGTPSTPNVPSLVPTSPPSGIGRTPTAAAANDSGGVVAEAEEILNQFRVTPEVVKHDVRKGCFLYFAAAFLLLGLVVVAIYIAFRPR